MGKRVFFVTGPEGSGNYMMTEALRLSGVTEVLRGIRTYNTNYMNLIASFPNTISFMRSLPAARMWPNFDYAIEAFKRWDYEIDVLFMTRDFNATYESQKRRGSPYSRIKAEENIRRAYQIVACTFEYFIPVSYEAFCNSEGFRKWLFIKRLGLPATTIELREENEKYYRWGKG